jgi:AcrR family transcriptional regulator
MPTPAATANSSAPPANREADEQKRVLRTAAAIAAREGYAELSVAQIIHESGVRDETFFDRFETTEQCFLAAMELVGAEALAKAWRRARMAEDWAGAVQLGIAALLEHIASDRTFARVAFVEVFATGADGVRLREEMLRRTAELLMRYAPKEKRPSGVVAEAIVGAVWSLAYDCVARERAHELPALAGYASYMALAPVLGAKGAVERILATPEIRSISINTP